MMCKHLKSSPNVDQVLPEVLRLTVYRRNLDLKFVVKHSNSIEKQTYTLIRALCTACFDAPMQCLRRNVARSRGSALRSPKASHQQSSYPNT